MPSTSAVPNRSSLRLKGYDYTQTGCYFVTIVTQDRKSLFGRANNGKICLNRYGEIIAANWEWLGAQYHYVELGAWVVMPNHFHGILIIHDTDRWGGLQIVDGRGGSRTAPTDLQGAPPKIKPLGSLVGALKTVSTKKINLLRGTQGAVIWQRNYYDHIIRNQEDLELTWLYIESNPAQWLKDEENPARIS